MSGLSLAIAAARLAAPATALAAGVRAAGVRAAGVRAAGVRAAGVRAAGALAVAVLAVAVLAVAALALPAPAAAAQEPDDVFVEVNPTTIQAGLQVGIRAGCGEDPSPATVTSRAFGELTLSPSEGQRRLTGSATVPSGTGPGQYPVNLRCADGATASTALFVIDMARPTRGPKTGGGGTAAGPAGPDPPAGGGPVAGPVLAAGAGVIALATGAALLARRRRRAG